MNLGKVLELVAGHLEAQGQPFCLVGGLGLAALGLPRATLDLDLVVPAEAQNRLIAFMEGLGYETLYRSRGYSNHLHRDESMGRVDFVYVRGATRDRIFSAAAEAVGPAGTKVLVPRPEHLAAMKVLAIKSDPARRLQDLADIQRLLALPAVDREEIRGYFKATVWRPYGMSSGRPKPLDSLAADLETSQADVEALRRAAALRPADPFAAVQELIDALPPAARRQSRKTAVGRPDFVL